ncbi:MAG: 2-phospho-L-lactate transferase [Woeseia sp.]
MIPKGHVVALSGGVGGAKLALGLASVLPSSQLSIVANTGDDFEYLGLHISPDIDSLIYTLAGVNNPVTGWGRANESWTFMSEAERLGIDSWFRTGDKDLAVHVHRTSRLRSGSSLSAVTDEIARRMGIAANIIPMSDDPVRTYLETDVGTLAFQDYFVRHGCKPQVSGIRFQGCETAAPSPMFRQLLDSPDLAAVVLCPSNPYLSIDPVLSIPGVVEALACNKAPVIAVSPIVQGQAIKGPTAKIMGELGVPVTPAAVADHYQGLIDGFVLDSSDGELSRSMAGTGLAVEVANTVMQSLGDRASLARTVLEFSRRLQHAPARPRHNPRVRLS